MSVGVLLYLLMNLFLVSNSSLIDPQGGYSEKRKLVVFVSASSGKDSTNCGQKDRPCESIKYALQLTMASNMTTALVNVLPGNYRPEAARIDCSNIILQRLVLKGLGDNVYIGLSADIIKCDVAFVNVVWNDSHQHPVLISLILSSFSLINSTIANVSFSLLGSGSIIELVNSAVRNCTGWQPFLPLISATSLPGYETNLVLRTSTFEYNRSPLLSIKGMTAALQHCSFISNSLNKGSAFISLDEMQTLVTHSNFTRNIGTNLKMTGGSVVNITQSFFYYNNVLDGTLLGVGGSVSLKAMACSFIKSHGISVGPVLKTSPGVGNVVFVGCHFSCNQVNDSLHESPIKDSAKPNHVNCTNCTVDPQCLVFCSGGEYLESGIMCLPCPSGTYNPANQYNITAYACRRCEPGYYSPRPGQNYCIPCKQGQFAAKSGSTTCTPCKNDFMTSSEGQESCSKWKIGFTVLTVCVVLLILLPLVLLLIQYLKERKQWRPNKQKNFKRLYDAPIQS